MNSLFDELIHPSNKETVNNSASAIPKVENATWEPAIEIKETDENLILQAQVPGIEPQDLDIDVTYLVYQLRKPKIIYRLFFSMRYRGKSEM